jgi:hypothetical protein
VAFPITPFKARKVPDFSVVESKNRELGQKGELLVVEREKEVLIGRPPTS